MPKCLFIKQALLKSGWAENILLQIGDTGIIQSLEVDAENLTAAEHVDGMALPGMVNLHSHSFQRLMAGLAEQQRSPGDNFWSWREMMYALTARLQVDDLRIIARQLQIECLKQGYTGMCEFHYLHHQPDGTPYNAPAQTSLAILEAALETGIALTHLPVLYQHAGFGGQPPGDLQKPFINTPDKLLQIVADCISFSSGRKNLSVGLALHSLRAVGESGLNALQDGMAIKRPIHLHISEQEKEVQDCLDWCAKRPVERLFDLAAVDENWCLVHATHLHEAERKQIAASGAVVGICPLTEANLGDGLFPLAPFLQESGCFGIGSDSHVSRCPAEELRFLEYAQRLALQKRNIAASPEHPSVGCFLWQEAVRGGARASGRKGGEIAPGQIADLIFLDSRHVDLAGRALEQVVDGFIFSGGKDMVRHVMVAGDWVIRDFHHPLEAQSAQDYKTLAERILPAI